MPRVPLLIVLVALLPGVSPRVAAAQHPAATYWESLQRARTAGAVESVRVPDGLDAKLARGMRHGRTYELTGRRGEAYRGRALLEAVVARRQADPWAHFALGALLARGPDARQRAPGDAGRHFVDEYSLAYGDALKALRRALELDPGHAPAAQELVELGLDARDRQLVDEGLGAFSPPDTSAAQHLLLARADWFRGDVAGTAEQARRAEGAGADVSVAAHLRAVALLQLPERERDGERAYFAGLAPLSATGAAAYWRGIGPIATVAESDSWERTPTAERADWIVRFWRLRAARAGVPVRERLAMHFRRVHEADVRFPLRGGMRDGNAMARIRYGIDPRDFGMSLHGLLLVRHGDPHRLDALHACDPWGIPYYIERDAGAPVGVQDAYVAHADAMATRMMALGLPTNLRLSCRPATGGVAGSQLRRVTHELIGADSYTPPVTARLLFATSVYAFRGEGATVDLVAALALPSGAVRVLANGSATLHADLTFAVFDDAAGEASVVHTRLAQTVVPARLQAGGPELLTLVQTQVATSLSGPLAFRVMLRDTTGAHAGGWLGGALNVPSFTGSDPQLSDLVLAPGDARGAWRRGEISLSPAPGKAYGRGEPLQLFYEVYHIAEGAAYRTEIVLAPQEAGLWAAARRLVRPARNVVHVQFEEVARAPHPRYGLQELRSLGTPDLEPGIYRVEVRVTELATDRMATRTRLIDITAP